MMNSAELANAKPDRLRMIKASQYTESLEAEYSAIWESQPHRIDAVVDNILAALGLTAGTHDAIVKAGEWANEIDKGLIAHRTRDAGVDLFRADQTLVCAWREIAVAIRAAVSP